MGGIYYNELFYKEKDKEFNIDILVIHFKNT
jgi:hypothetical protein